ncbi:MAG: hypothetical protein CL878_00165 [Dehalococcoidia bacterium]|nr:hypothetical protein [Dehalococcoidia bacterium]
MRRTVVWTVGSFLGGRILERVVAAALGSAGGRRFMKRWDKRELTPFEHRTLAQQWAGGIAKTFIAAGPILAAVMSLRSSAESGGEAADGRKPFDWIQALSRAAELLLAVGAILKVVGEYLEDREDVEAEHEG